MTGRDPCVLSNQLMETVTLNRKSIPRVPTAYRYPDGSIQRYTLYFSYLISHQHSLPKREKREKRAVGARMGAETGNPRAAAPCAHFLLSAISYQCVLQIKSGGGAPARRRSRSPRESRHAGLTPGACATWQRRPAARCRTRSSSTAERCPRPRCWRAGWTRTPGISCAPRC